MPRFLLPLAVLVVGSACDHAKASPTKDEGFRLINADALVAMQADAAHPVHLYDANDDDFRKAEGVIAGAVLLKDHHDYDVASTLPPDKTAPLVFYCSSRL